MKILVVEDQEQVREIIALRLAKTGLPIAGIVAAEDWHAAGNQATAHRPDVILFDLGLPDSRPEETLAGLRQFSTRFPVVVISGHNEALYWRRSVTEAGAMDYLPKVPFLTEGNEGFLGHSIFNAWLTYPHRA